MPRPERFTASEHHKMSRKEKRKRARMRVREPAIVCPHCETSTTVADLMRHVRYRCPGRPSPHRLSQWVSFAAVSRVVPSRATVWGWVRSGRVRVRESAEGRPEYLLRDVVRNEAMRRSPGVGEGGDDSDGGR